MSDGARLNTEALSPRDLARRIRAYADETEAAQLMSAALYEARMAERGAVKAYMAKQAIAAVNAWAELESGARPDAEAGAP